MTSGQADVQSSETAALDLFADTDHLLHPLINAAKNHPSSPIIAERKGSHFVDQTSAELWTEVQGVARGLIARGVNVGDRVAIMCRTRREWLVVDHAIMAAGAITVPVYETSSPSQIDWILHDSDATMIIVETEQMAAAARSVAANASMTCDVLAIEGSAITSLIDEGQAVTAERLAERVDGIEAATIATIIYTSGTTGRPKGCVLTHGNLRANVHQVSDALRGTIQASETCLLFLPLAHVLTKTAALYCLERRVRIAFATSVDQLAEEMALAKPSLIAAVPRIFEKVYAKAQHKAESENKGRIFERSAQIAVRWSQQREAGKISRAVQLEHKLYDRLVYGKIRQAFGGHLRLAFSGGGPLGERLTSYFDGIGLRIYEGYGLTETSPILTLSRVDGWSPGAVGAPVVDTELRLDTDGEILARGPQIFAGYWRNEAATNEAIDADGWFRTGDIGEFDDDGYLHIIGRSKDLIITAAGKNVAPAPLEDLLQAHSLISQAMLVGDRRPFIAALVTLDPEAVEEWVEHHDRSEIEAEIQQAIDHANASVSRAESIRQFAILPHEFDLASEEITPTLKVRRAVVRKHYADVIESLYTS